jgi:hypothetical protein
MNLEEKKHFLFVLRQAMATIDRRLDDLKIEIENDIKLHRLPEQLKDEYGTARLENKPIYEVSQLALRDALIDGLITFDELMENDCISFRGAEVYKRFPEYAEKYSNECLVVRLEKIDDDLGILCQCPKYWRGEE